MKIEENKKRSKKAMGLEGDGDTSCIWRAWIDPQKLGKGAGRVGNRRTSRGHPNYSIAKNGQNRENSPGHLKKLGLR